MRIYEKIAQGLKVVIDGEEFSGKDVTTQQIHRAHVIRVDGEVVKDRFNTEGGCHV